MASHYKSEGPKKYPPRRDSQSQEGYGPKRIHKKPRRTDGDLNRSQNSRGARGRGR